MISAKFIVFILNMIIIKVIGFIRLMLERILYYDLYNKKIGDKTNTNIRF